MRVLVTGGAGFIGQHVCRLLREQGHYVVVVDCMEERVHPNPDDWSGGYWDRFHMEYAGCVEPEWLANVDAVVHLAAQVSVADSQKDPGRYHEDNSGDSLDFYLLLNEFAPELRTLVVASSCSVYGAGTTLTEAAPVSPMSVYGLTKYDQERLAFLLMPAHVRTSALRLFNIYGPGQALSNPYTGALANFAQRILADQSPIIYEDGLQLRSFTYVDDAAHAFVQAAEDSEVRGVYNIAHPQPTTVLQAASMLASALDRPDILPRVTGETRPGDVRHVTGQTNRHEIPRPHTPFSEGIERYGQWLLQHS